MAASSGSSDHINPKLPTWNGDWKTFSDFRFACLLELDGCKTDEKSLLAPRLVRNLTDRAWECVLDIDREALRKADGVEYLLKFLKERRGKQEVDLLGDSLQQYFQNPDCFRKEGENLNDFSNQGMGPTSETSPRQWWKMVVQTLFLLRSMVGLPLTSCFA
jgi:hypothetical protein